MFLPAVDAVPGMQAFAKMFKSTPDELDMHVVYDVSHNIAKVRCGAGATAANQWDGFEPIFVCQ